MMVFYYRYVLRNKRLTGHLEEEVSYVPRELDKPLMNERKSFSDRAHDLKAPVTAIQGSLSW